VGRLIWSKATLLCVLTISLAFNAGFGTTFAVRTYHHHHQDRKERRGSKGFHKWPDLGLSEEEQAALEAGRKTLFEEMKALRRAATEQHERLADLVTAPEPDRDAISAQLEQAALVQQQIQKRLVEHMLEQRALLAEEHHEQFNEMIRKRLLRSGPRHGGPRRHKREPKGEPPPQPAP